MAYTDYYGVDPIQKILSAHNITLKKRWGQNFITEKHAAQRIAKLIYAIAEKYYKRDAIYFWEIGPGLGALTNFMLEERDSTHVTLFEVDYGIIAILRESIDDTNLSHRIALISGDAVDTLIDHASAIALDVHPQVIYGNLPYSSAVRIMYSASLIPTLLHMRAGGIGGHESLHSIEIPNRAYKDIPYVCSIPMCYMLQSDVAARIMAPPTTKLYGITTILFQSFYDVSVIHKVSPHIFYPKPHVDSVLCEFIPRTHAQGCTLYQRNILKRIVCVAFNQRRKKLSNTLGKFLDDKGITTYRQMCEHADLNLHARPEEIPHEKYMTIAILISQYLIAHSELPDVLL